MSKLCQSVSERDPLLHKSISTQKKRKMNRITTDDSTAAMTTTTTSSSRNGKKQYQVKEYASVERCDNDEEYYDDDSYFDEDGNPNGYNTVAGFTNDDTNDGLFRDNDNNLTIDNEDDADVNNNNNDDIDRNELVQREGGLGGDSIGRSRNVRAGIVNRVLSPGKRRQQQEQQQQRRTRRLIVPGNNTNIPYTTSTATSSSFCIYTMTICCFFLIGSILIGTLIQNKEWAQRIEDDIESLWSRTNSSSDDASTSDDATNDVLSSSSLSDNDSGSDSITHVVSSSLYSARTVHYDSIKVASLDWNPYDFDHTRASDEASRLVIPSPLVVANENVDDTTNDTTTRSSQNDNDDDDDEYYGYIHFPNIVNNSIVFVSEGDLYYTQMRYTSNTERRTLVEPMTAMKLATTVGNVQSPKINPYYQYYVAFRATYEVQSEIYLLDLRKRKRAKPVQRITFTETGVARLIGWNTDGTSLIYSATNNDIGFQDDRLYEVTLLSNTTTQFDSTRISISTMTEIPGTNNIVKSPSGVSFTTPHVLQVRPIPLAQATEGVMYSSINDDCLYFVRYRQYSKTARYIGGLAESIWAYCNNETVTVHITHDYIGTSKNPQIVLYNSQPYLLFLSDRSLIDGKWKPTTMNLWAMPLPNRSDMYSSAVKPNSTKSILYNIDPSTYIQLTFVSCQFNGKALQEYSVDTFSGTVLLRIGVDLYFTSLQDVMSSTKSIVPNRCPIHVISDFREQRERLIKYDTNKHLSSGDFFVTTFDTVNMILTARGQVWIVPVIDDYSAYESTTYGGSGENMPPDRRYRVVPGAMTGGSIRVLKALHVPLLAESVNHDSIFHSNGTANSENTTTATPIDSGRRLALLLATDPDSLTAEHAFYMIEVQADAINSFTSLDRLPKPFIGGSVSGGPTSLGGLGTVDPSTLKVSPCGRRFAWTDTDNRICVMTMPIYTDPNFMPASLENVTAERTDDSWMVEEQIDDDVRNKTKASTTKSKYQYYCLPSTNDNGEPMAGTMADLNWSPGGRYLALEHSARNQFSILTVVDCGDPETSVDNGDNETATTPTQKPPVADIKIGRAVQITPSRFNSYGMYWGISSFDIFLQNALDSFTDSSRGPSTTIYFLSDRDVISDVESPWGSRQPLPHFPRLMSHVYALPLKPKRVVQSTFGDDDTFDALLSGRFAGGSAMEVYARKIEEYKKSLNTDSDNDSAWNFDDRRRRRNLISKLTEAFANIPKHRRLSSVQRDLLYWRTSGIFKHTATSPFPKDMDIDFPSLTDVSLNTYRISKIEKDKFVRILAQCHYGGSLTAIVSNGDGHDDTKNFMFYLFDSFPSDGVTSQTIENIKKYGLSTDRKHLYITSELGKIKAVANDASSISVMMSDEEWTSGRANHEGLALSVWPALEYQQLYNDAWRLLRDYFYDVNMHGVDWNAVHARYKGLVKRCAKREELDDVLGQMISELSALHAFVYGGEFQVPTPPNALPAFLGAQLVRTPEWKGYMITEIPQPDPDFSMLDGNQVYSPLSDQTLRLSGQTGLHVGDIVVAVNGESVLNGVDVNMHLRGLAGRSVRLEVLRLSSSSNASKMNHSTISEAIPESLIVVPIGTFDYLKLQYNAHEWKTRQKAKELAAAAGITIGYVHMQGMDKDGVDAFARGYFPDYDKQGLIIDVRHNQGGNTDSWIESYLQRKVWSYWRGRSATTRNGDIDWDQQFAFRGKVVVLVDEYTASNGEGVARGISELGLGKTIGTKTWGGGIWGSSANHLVDGGIAAAPQWGTWNEKFGWGSGIEMTGLTPDIIVDNDPYQTYFGNDFQLEVAIKHLKEAIHKDPVAEPNIPEPHPDMSLKGEVCPVDE